MTYRESMYGMHKKADGWISDIIGATGDTVKGVSDMASEVATYVIAAGLAGSALAGWATAKATAPGKRELDTVRKSYENERFKADLGYLSARLRQEYQQGANTQVRRSARVLA